MHTTPTASKTTVAARCGTVFVAVLLALTASGCSDADPSAAKVESAPTETAEPDTVTPTPTKPAPVPTEPAEKEGRCCAETTDTTLEFSKHGTEVRVTYSSVGDTIVRQVTRNTVPYEVANLPDRKTAKESFASSSQQYEGITGLDQAIEFRERDYVETLTVDYRRVDPAVLAENPAFALGVLGAGGERGGSMKKAITALRADGYVVIE